MFGTNSVGMSDFNPPTAFGTNSIWSFGHDSIWFTDAGLISMFGSIPTCTVTSAFKNKKNGYFLQ